LGKNIDPRVLIAVGSGIAVLLAGIFLLLRRSRKKRSKTVTAAQALPKSTQESAKALQAASDNNGPEAIAAYPETARISEQAAKMEKLMGSVRHAVSIDPALVAGVVRNWLEERPS
jgi:flagellar biosynthesis/type III secretory pathway M-ring protein FliF/YscJ